MCGNLSVGEFKSYFEHVRSLRFEDRPDYDYLKRLFRELFCRKGFSYDNMFDWELLALAPADRAQRCVCVLTCVYIDIG